MSEINPFTKRASEQFGEDSEYYPLSLYSGDEYNVMVAEFVKRGKLCIPDEADLAKIESGEWRRTSGESICVVCENPYWKHPVLHHHAWLHRICDGLLAKL